MNTKYIAYNIDLNVTELINNKSDELAKTEERKKLNFTKTRELLVPHVAKMIHYIYELNKYVINSTRNTSYTRVGTYYGKELNLQETLDKEITSLLKYGSYGDNEGRRWSFENINTYALNKPLWLKDIVLNDNEDEVTVHTEYRTYESIEDYIKDVTEDVATHIARMNK